MEENKSAYDHLREKATDTNEAHDTPSAYATVADFVKEVKESSFTLSDGKPVKFRAIRPLDCQATDRQRVDFGDVGIRRFAGRRDKREVTTSVLRSVAHCSPTRVILIDAQSLIVQVSVQPPFSMLPVGVCPPDKVPVELLSKDDTYKFRDAIESFSGVEQAEEEFRGDSETGETEAGSTDAEGTGEPADDSDNGEGVRAVAV